VRTGTYFPHTAQVAATRLVVTCSPPGGVQLACEATSGASPCW
jgi:hypothetical protein